MIMVDANLLVYAASRAAPEHEAARTWLDEQLSGVTRVGLPWPALLAFVRLVTNPLVLRRPVSTSDAWNQARAWLSASTAWVPTPTEQHSTIIGAWLSQSWMTSRLVPDAHLAALAVEHGLTLYSTDGDFSRFPDLVWRNPLAAPTT
jgi:toxin-antitoxin system PIN domain toxin